MSEEILKALMQLFAIITKQDEGVSSEQRRYVQLFLEKELDKVAAKEYLQLYEELSGYGSGVKDPADERKKRTSVGDSVRTLAICKKINKTLAQKQKFIVLIRLLDLVNADKILSPVEVEIVDTVATVFKIDKEEFTSIKSFVIDEDPYIVDAPYVLIVDGQRVIPDTPKGLQPKHIYSELFEGHLKILQVPSVDLYFITSYGKSEVLLNGLTLTSEQIFLFANGSSIKPPVGPPIYYSDIVAQFRSDQIDFNLCFTANSVHYSFPNGKIALRDITLGEGTGNLVGFMGASGSGKTTLLNVLNGNTIPAQGKVLINGIDIHNEKDKIEGVIGYVPQEDSLIEDLTVYQNLFFNARLCFRDFSKPEINELVLKVLRNLGLEETKDLKVGSLLQKTISGGQRKRLNIGLELIREPSVLFIDEPTSGLSSRDSENIMDLLKELTSKGKLIFVVIHQPSSDIYKMFDKILILDGGGYPIFYGNPIEAIMYFKRLSNQINSDRGECPDCGKVDPELIFNIIEEKLIDDYGNFRDERKVSPQDWNGHFMANRLKPIVKEVDEKPESNLKIPSRFKQLQIFILRDFLAKLKNTQYLLINLLEAPLLAFLLAFIIRYTDDPNAGVYLYRQNENIPAYLFMAVIVVLFMGLSVSAEEIIRDKKLRKREAFLNLSKSSYLLSKTFILFFISAIQTFSFVILGNWILDIRGMNMSYWVVLFTTACFANITGLNISSAFRSAVTVYILIPLLLIPQMILSGAMFKFDKLNDFISGRRDRVPVLAEFMTSRWAYEALVVDQFINNEYEKKLYEMEKMESIADYKKSYLIPTLIKKVETCRRNYDTDNEYLIIKAKNDLEILESNLNVLGNEITSEMAKVLSIKFSHVSKMNIDEFSPTIADSTQKYLQNLKNFYIQEFNFANSEKDYLISEMQSDPRKRLAFRYTCNAYHNENLADIVRNTMVKNRIIEQNNRLIQQIDPIYLEPVNIAGMFDFRAHFYAPVKHFMGRYYSTYWFNVIAIWVMTLLLYFTLYFDLLYRIINGFSNVNIWKNKTEVEKG